MNGRSIGAFVLALLIFAAVTAVYSGIARWGVVEDAPPWIEQAAIKSALLVVSLVLIALDRRRSFAEYGFRRPTRPARWSFQLLLGGAIGAAAATLVFVTPAEGMRSVLEGYGLLDLILWIWLYSTLSEEVFTRGWFQTSVEPAAGRQGAILASAALFGALHLSLLFRHADLWTVAIIVSTTTLLGWVAARARSSSGSLWPAVAAHFAFNVGGTAAGIMLTIASMLLNRSS